MPITVPPDTGTTAGIRGFFMHASGSIQAGNRKKTTVFHKKDSCISEKRQLYFRKKTVVFTEKHSHVSVETQSSFYINTTVCWKKHDCDFSDIQL